ncbi:thioredoxin fold domain-containing protein [Sulfurimonas sp. SWIR-19]|uniref:thioredoxin family protein n=1 Tax=Sulfurimonas sp. SWIR-19 TaxID=2878390 RepID=UPI001CF26513|nr:thioredoxin fold domain-containing protein [Sulfurimonas sp. SWIR-19]UCM99341.1 thioredoxin fold domain-containing protein [Sulfurimonas sp. SWIR-19]
MNKFIFLVLLSSLSLWGLEFHTYEEALKIQKKNNKIIMIDVIRSDCQYCIKMKKEVFDNPEMSAWIEERFIPVELNLDFDELPLGLHVYFTPTFFFVDKNQKIIKKIPGSWNIQDFKDLTKNIK